MHAQLCPFCLGLLLQKANGRTRATAMCRDCKESCCSELVPRGAPTTPRGRGSAAADHQLCPHLMSSSRQHQGWEERHVQPQSLDIALILMHHQVTGRKQPQTKPRRYAQRQTPGTPWPVAGDHQETVGTTTYCWHSLGRDLGAYSSYLLHKFDLFSKQVGVACQRAQIGRHRARANNRPYPWPKAGMSTAARKAPCT